MSNPSPLSRRDFLKVSGLALAGLWLPRWSRPTVKFSTAQGRVINPIVNVYDRPSFQAQRVKTFWQDTVIPISEVTIGDEEPAYNRVWYRIGNIGYTHSGAIQPVRTELQTPSADIPKGGMLAEVTVPYTDARWDPIKEHDVAYRFYYATTHWVTDLVEVNHQTWYQVMDDKWDFVYYTPAQHLRLIPPQELAPLSPSVPPEDKRIEIHLDEQVVMAFEYERPVFMARTATGAVFSNGIYTTPSGRFLTFHKRPSRHMAAGNLAANGYDLPGVPWVSYITEEGISFHGTFWHNDYGKPRSHGCINLTPQAAKWIFLWTMPVVPAFTQRVYGKYGTTVDIS